MSCAVCHDNASAKISIGKAKGTLLMCGSCYNHVNASTVGADAATSAEPEGYVHIHKDSEEFAGLQFLASHLGEHFATVLDLPHNDLNRYKSTVKVAHYRLPLRVVHPIANGLGLIGLPLPGEDGDPSDASQSDEGDPSDAPPSSTSVLPTLTSTASGTSAETSLSLASAATPSSLASAATPSSLASVATPSSLASVATPSSLTSVATQEPQSADAISFFQSKDIPPEILAQILSKIDLRAFLTMISSSATTRVPYANVIRTKYYFDFAPVTSQTFSRVLGNTSPEQWLFLMNSSAPFNALLTQLKVEKRNIFIYLLWLYRAIIDDTFNNRAYDELCVTQIMGYDAIYRILVKDKLIASEDVSKAEIIQHILSMEYIPLTISVERFPAVFATCHVDIRNAILEIWRTFFDFSTWRYPVMLNCLMHIMDQWRRIVVLPNNSINITPLKDISTLCRYFIDHRHVFRGVISGDFRLNAESFFHIARTAQTIHYRCSIPGVATHNLVNVYNTVVAILEVLSYWYSVESFIGILPLVMEIRDRAVNDAEYSVARAIIEVLRGMINRRTATERNRIKEEIQKSPTEYAYIEQLTKDLQQIGVKLPLCRLLFTEMVPSSVTLNFYMEMSNSISLTGCNVVIARILPHLSDADIVTYTLYMATMMAIMERLSRATITDIKSDTDLFGGVDIFNEESNILSCVTLPLMMYIPAAEGISNTYTPQQLRVFLMRSRISQMQGLCVMMLNNISRAMPDLHPHRTVLLKLSMYCRQHLFILDDFLAATSVKIDLDTLCQVLTFAATRTGITQYPKNNEVFEVSKQIVEDFKRLLNRLTPIVVENVLKLDTTNELIASILYIARATDREFDDIYYRKTPDHDMLLQRIFTGVKMDVVYFALAKLYFTDPIYRGRSYSEESNKLRKLLRKYDLRAYGPLFGKHLLYLMKADSDFNNLYLSTIEWDMSIQLEENDAKNADVLITILQYYRSSLFFQLDLCIRLTGSNLVTYDTFSRKYTLRMSDAEMRKLVQFTQFDNFQDRHRNITNWPDTAAAAAALPPSSTSLSSFAPGSASGTSGIPFYTVPSFSNYGAATSVLSSSTPSLITATTATLPTQSLPSTFAPQ